MFNFIHRRCFLVPHLRVFTTSSSPIHRQFSLSLSSSSTISSLSNSNSSKEDSFTVNYLINSCGLPPKSAFLASKHLNIKTPNNADSVIAFFKNTGFTNAQMVRVIRAHPKILLCNPEKTLSPKLEFFSYIGLETSHIVRLITTAPVVLCCSLQNKINPNINLLRELGVPESNIINHLINHPGSLRLGTSRFRRIVEEAKEIGFSPSKYILMEAFHTLNSISKSTWQKKLEVYKRWDWSEADILLAFGRRPLCITVYEDKITRVMDFLINKMGMEYSLLVKYPILFSFSLEKKTAPRCLLYQALSDKGLMKKDKDVTLIGLLVVSENVFLNRIKMLFKEEAPQLLKLYQAFRPA